MLVATVAVDDIRRGAWEVVADGLVSWTPEFVRGTIHRPMRVHLLPQIMVRQGQLMVQLIFVKDPVHPALHIVTTESKECDARSGITWATQAPAGRSGKSRVQVCANCTLSPFGRRAMRGTAARTMFVAGALDVKKWLIAPESRMANCFTVVASTLIVLIRMEAARVYLWVGAKQ
jgi:hypothetical protein